MFESAICLIQSYIFCLLLSLYSDDHSISLNSIK
jgi:F0F1-type ATP synthase membrane subunit a